MKIRWRRIVLRLLVVICTFSSCYIIKQMFLLYQLETLNNTDKRVSVDIATNQEPRKTPIREFAKEAISVAADRSIKENKKEFLILFFAVHDTMLQAKRKSPCELKNCRFTFDRELLNKSDLVFFHYKEIAEKKMHPPPKKKGQLWLWYSLETAPHVCNWTRKPEWSGIFDITATYRKQSLINNVFGTITENTEATENRNFEFIFSRKTKDVAWVSTGCFSNSAREKYVKELGKYIDIDIFGSCGTLLDNKTEDKFLELSKKYKFYLAFENSLCLDYASEQLHVWFHDWRNLVPVVRGAPNIKDIMPNGSFISTSDFQTPKELALFLKKVGTNKTLYIEYLKAKNRHTSVLNDMKCEMCNLLNNGIPEDKGLGTEEFFTNHRCIAPHDISFE